MEPAGSKPKVLILGSGFAAFSLLKKISLKSYHVTVVSPRNHFLFTPLLPSTTVGTIEFRSIIEPIRVAREGIVYYQAFAKNLDAAKKTLLCENALDGREFELGFDYLVIAVGAVSGTFNIPGVKENALFLKELWDARTIRQRIIGCLERASTPNLDEEEKRRLLHFVVVGGGPTGVEFAAEMHDFLEEDLSEWYPDLTPHVRITLLEAMPLILGSFDHSLAEYTMKNFKRQKIEVRTGSLVSGIGPQDILLKDGTRIPYGMVVWATGLAPTPFVAALPYPKDKTQRLITNSLFEIPAHPHILSIGDCANLENANFPATAQVAQQQGSYLAKILNRRARGRETEPFEYRHMGMMAYIGSHKALADLPGVKGRGFATWIFWRSAYVTKLVSLKNKILVLFDWFIKLLFGRDISRF